MLFKNSFLTLSLLLITLSLNAEIKYFNINKYISTGVTSGSPVNVDIDQDGLWDVKLNGTAGGTHYIQCAFTDVNNCVLVNIISQAEPNPVPFPKDADMQAVGKWVYISQQGGGLVIKDFVDQGTKYIGIILVKKGIQYCAWIHIFNWGTGTLGVGYVGWENENKSKCILAGQTSYPSTEVIPVSVSNVLIYPNPSTDFFYVQGITSDATINIMNALGENVLSTVISSGIPLSVAELPPGIYFVSISEGDKVSNVKLMIAR